MVFDVCSEMSSDSKNSFGFLVDEILAHDMYITATSQKPPDFSRFWSLKESPAQSAGHGVKSQPKCPVESIPGFKTLIVSNMPFFSLSSS